jgi:hypothetical protein
MKTNYFEIIAEALRPTPIIFDAKEVSEAKNEKETIDVECEVVSTEPIKTNEN